MSKDSRIEEMNEVYVKAIEEIEKLDPKGDPLKSYCMIRTLLSRLVLDFQTWKSLLGDWSLIDKFSEKELAPILYMLKQLTIVEVEGMKNIMQSEPVKNAYETAIESVKKTMPQNRPIPERMVYVDRSNANTESKKEVK